jgi:hypothetical protein
MKTILPTRKVTSLTKISRFLALAMMAIICSAQLFAQPLDMTGTYTIDKAGGDYASKNFKSFSEAVDSLISRGIAGPVEINAADDTYDERFTITAIPGVTASDTVVFQSASADSNKVFLDYSGFSSSNNTMVTLNGCSYITFKHISFITTQGAGTDGLAIFLAGGCHHINILNNSFTGKSGAGSSINDDIALIFGWGTDTEYINIKNNRMNFGENAVKISGESAGSLARGIVVKDNFMNNQGDGSVYLRMCDAPIVNNNSITNTINARFGIQLSEVDKAFRIIGNDIELKDLNLGIQAVNCDPTPGSEALIANNFVASTSYGGSNNAGIWLKNTSYTRVYHNTVKFTGSFTTGEAFYQSDGGSDIDIQNNSFANHARGYAIHINNNSAILECDFNNYYSSGNMLGYWAGYKITLDDIKAASDYNDNSISVNPVHPSGTADLHTTNFRLESKGSPSTTISDHVPDDIDGELRSSPPDIGADEFTGVGEAFPAGEYFVGGADADFATLWEAFDSLNEVGVAGPVIFSLRDDAVFAERKSITPISGASSTNTITIRSDPANATQAVISYNSTSGSYTWRFVRASYITLKDLNFTAENSTNSTAILFEGYCHHDSIIGCTINSTGTSSGNAAIYANGNIIHDIYIGHNSVISGNVGIQLSNHSDYVSISKNIVVDSNTVEGHYRKGIGVNYSQAPKVRGNWVTDGTSTYNYWGINLGYCTNDYEITGNRVRFKTTYGGIETHTCTGSASFKGLIANNYVECYGSESGGANGIHPYLSTHVNVYNNTSKIEGNSNTGTNALAIQGCSDVVVKNNNLINFSQGRAYYKDAASTNVESDYNNLYAHRIRIGYWDGTEYFDFNSLSSVSGDAHSTNAHPWFLEGDSVYVNSTFIDGKGVDIPGITTDIHGETRSSPPDIGADEFTPVGATPMSGPYTIGGADPDFTTIKSAIDSLEVKGISGPVKLSIRSGNYEELIGGIGQISGASAQDTIVLESESGNRDDVVIYSNAGSTMITFVGTDYFTLQNLTLSSTNPTDGRTLAIVGNCNDVRIISA